MDNKFKISKAEAIKIVEQCSSIADFCRAVGWVPRGDNYKIFHKYEREYNLDTSHFRGKASNAGNQNFNEKDLSEYLKYGTNCQSSVLKKKLLKEGLKVYKCERCGLTEWLGEQISLHLHHINGDHFDNRLENLMLLCPNCHSQTDSFAGKKNQNKKKYYCFKCGKLLYEKSESGMCCSCYHASTRKVERPSKEELDVLIHNKSFSDIGKMFNVTSNAIRKWCKSYGLPHKKSSLKY
jgi:ribosomal protein L37E